MSEDIYAKPDLTKKVRYGPRDREGETEDRGDWEEMAVEIYATADYPDRNPAPDPDPDPNPEPKPEPNPDPDPNPDPKPDPDPGTQQASARNNTAQQQRGAPKESKQNLYIVACVVLLCLLLLAGIIVLLVLYVPLQSGFDQLQTRHDNLTEQRDQWKTMFSNMTEQRDQWKTSFDQLQTRLNNMTELKRILCESHGFTFGGDGCYYISTEKKTWDDSRAFCTARQSDLMTIKSLEKQDFVKGLVGRNKIVWLGLTDSETEGVWKWVDGTVTPLTKPTSFWGPWQPNDGGPGGEDCGGFHNGEEWHDFTCEEPHYWICEIVF